jgi:hypothetical protein
VNHLGNHLSALVDGELSGTELDRANAHLAACERCRADAAALRALKIQLHALVADIGDDTMTSRLLAMSDHPSADGGHGRRGVLTATAGFGGFDGRRPPRAARRRYLVWSALSLAVVGGLGAAAFGMGGASSGTGPGVVPQVEWFSIEHAINSGDVPYPDDPATGHPATPHPASGRVATPEPRQTSRQIPRPTLGQLLRQAPRQVTGQVAQYTP